MSDHTRPLPLRHSPRSSPRSSPLRRKLAAEALEARRLLSVSGNSSPDDLLAALASMASDIATGANSQPAAPLNRQLLELAQQSAVAAPRWSLSQSAEVSFELTSLDEYVSAPDGNYSFSVAQTFSGPGFSGYVLKLRSQQWRSSDEVDRPVWEHWLITAIPHLLTPDATALLAITGGNNRSAIPPTNFSIPELGLIAALTGTVVAELRMVPNQPLIFSADGERAGTFLATGNTARPMELDFKYYSGAGGYEFSFGYYDVASVTANPVTAKQEYAIQAISSGTLLFDERIDSLGTTKSVMIPTGAELGFYIIPNDTPANFLADPGSYFLGGRPAPLFSLPSANPGQLDQMRVAIATGSTRLSFEDISRVFGGTSNFGDVEITINRELQAVPPAPGTDFVGLERVEDEIIAYTFDRFLATGDETWPALLPMVKSAVRAMDTVQQFVPAITGGAQVKDFVVSGGSKRGWTTWLTAAADAASADPRVKAIVPMVFDMLNFGEQLPHHKEFYDGVSVGMIDGYSFALEDYTSLDVIDHLDTPKGEQLLSIVDPYEYRDRLTLPKLMINSTGDEFFVPDSGQYYLDDLPGQNYVRYVPNTNHDVLDDSDAGETLIAYYHAIANDLPLPEFTWSVEDGGTTIRVNSIDTPLAVNVWQATNYATNDFRRSVTGIPWSSSPLAAQQDGSYVAHVAEPNIGSTAFMVELTFPGTIFPFKFTTRVSVLRAEEKPTVQPPLLPELVDDVNDRTLDASISDLTAVNGTVFFTRYDEAHGTELWKSNGTSGGTVLVADIYPGPNSSYPYHLTTVGGMLYFSALNPDVGRELWKSDGSAAGTVLVANSRPDIGGIKSSYPTELLAMGGMLFYSAFDDEHGQELWSTDGSTAGTRMVANIRPDNPDFSFLSSSIPTNLTNVGGRLFFTADDGAHGRELWWSDGTSEGTRLVLDARPSTGYGGYPQGSDPQFLTALGPTLYFTAFDNEHGRELWKSDGTAEGTLLVADINPTSLYGMLPSSYPTDLTAVGNTLFFSAHDELHGRELWKSDGTAEGTLLVRDIRVGIPGDYLPSSQPTNLTAVGGKLYFSAEDDEHGRELWTSDGTPDGTVLVANIYSDGPYGTRSSEPTDLVTLGGKLYFVANSDGYGRELWTSDGTSDGTTLVANIRHDSPLYPTGSYPFDLTAVGNKLYFSATDDEVGRELWLTTGTEESTKLVRDLNEKTPGSYPSQFTDVNGRVYFTASDEHGNELWVNDGLGTGARLVADIMPGGGSSYPAYLRNLGGVLFFTAFDGTHGRELWKTDGTAEGTVLVKDILPPLPYDPSSGSDPQYLTEIGGLLYFSANDGQHGRELWRSDGTEEGTVMVADIYNNPVPGWGSGSYPTRLTKLGGTLYFTAADGLHGRELWKSDGTAEGTLLVKDIRTISIYGYAGSSNPNYLTAVGGTLYFVARDDEHGSEVWKSDGTAEGTVLLADIYPGSPNYSSYPAGLISFGGELYFGAYHPDLGRELWKSDGTPAGTKLVQDLEPGPNGTDPSNLTLVNDRLFFTARHYSLGRELWSSDGTAQGTMPVKDIFPANGSSYPQQLTSVGDKLFFIAYDGQHGNQLWQSDGTPEGTARIRGPRGMVSAFYPNQLTSAGGKLYFSGVGDGIGYEPWVLVSQVPIAHSLSSSVPKPATLPSDASSAPAYSVAAAPPAIASPPVVETESESSTASIAAGPTIRPRAPARLNSVLHTVVAPAEKAGPALPAPRPLQAQIAQKRLSDDLLASLLWEVDVDEELVKEATDSLSVAEQPRLARAVISRPRRR